MMNIFSLFFLTYYFIGAADSLHVEAPVFPLSNSQGFYNTQTNEGVNRNQRNPLNGGGNGTLQNAQLQETHDVSGTSPTGNLNAVTGNGATLNGTAPIAKPLKASENDQSLNGTAPTVAHSVVAESVLNGTTADMKKIGPRAVDDVESEGRR